MKRSSISLCALLFLAPLLSAQDFTPLPEDTVTFAEHVAPIVFRHCLRCHDGTNPTTPFPLTTYQEVRKRAKVISMITKKGVMPPAVDELGYGDFANSARLSPQEIGIIGQWFSEGSKEGDPAKTPPLPQRSADWKLGPPDLVLRVEEPFSVPADAFSLSRNFRLPLHLDSPKWLRAVALRRYSNTFLRSYLYFDASGATVSIGADDLDGVALAKNGLSFDPPAAFGGHLLVTNPWPLPEGVAQLLSPGTSLVLQQHFQATGIEETVQPEIGLYFTDEPPTRTLLAVAIGSDSFEIPAENSDFHVRSQFKLPVAVEVVGVLPNAHMVATELRGWATVPDGSEVPLFWAKTWDYAQQQQLWYRNAIALPAGSVLEMDFRYDNSSDNFSNPNYPPEKVQWGLGMTQELAGLTVQILVASEADTAQLNEAYRAYRQAP